MTRMHLTRSRRTTGAVVVAGLSDPGRTGAGPGSAPAVAPAATSAPTGTSGARQHPGPSGHAATTTSAPSSIAPMVDVAADAATGGYWLVASDGAVFNFDAPLLRVGGGAAPDLAHRGHGRHPR